MLAELIEQANKTIQYYEQHNQCPTKRETIDKLVLPFIRDVLGADPHDPATVTTEFSPVDGLLKGDKVDYAVKQDGAVILIECKALNKILDDNAVQLLRYIGAFSEVILGILTDGRRYHFFTGLNNILDREPFFIIDILDLAPSDEERLKLFHLECLDVEGVKQDWETVDFLVQALENEWEEPSNDYITYFVKSLHKKEPLTESVHKQYARCLKVAHQIFLRRHTGSTPVFSAGIDVNQEKKRDPQPNSKPSIVTSDGWRPLAELTTDASIPPQIVRFADGSTKKVGTWAELIRAVALKLNDEGHFSPDMMPANLKALIYEVPEGKMNQRRLPLSHGLSISTSQNTEKCIEISKRLLSECGYDLEECLVCYLAG